MKTLYLTCAIAGISTLAACGDGIPSEPINVDRNPSDPKTFVTQVSRDVLTGAYDPTGFNSDDIQRLIAIECNENKLASYSEEPADNGRIAFTATCVGGTIFQ